MHLITPVWPALPGSSQGFRAFYLQEKDNLRRLIWTAGSHFPHPCQWWKHCGCVWVSEAWTRRLWTLACSPNCMSRLTGWLQLLNVCFPFLWILSRKFAFLVKKNKGMSHGVNKDLIYIKIFIFQPWVLMTSTTSEIFPDTVAHARKMFSRVE